METPVNNFENIEKPEIVVHETDLLIIGGGMSACGAAYEGDRWASQQKMKITMVDKAAVDRSGAVAMGLSAINTYIGKNTPEDYVRYVRQDLMGITREDLVYDLGRWVDDSIHLFEEWGLPIWKRGDDGHPLDGHKAAKAGKPHLKDGGEPVHSGKWQIMINGESYKVLVGEAGKIALENNKKETGVDQNLFERVFVVKMLKDHDTGRVAGAVGFSAREHKLFIFKCKAAILATGGCVNFFRGRATAEGQGRAWFPVWNAGSNYAMAANMGAELTLMENRFVPARFKDGYGPVGAWFLLFKAKATNALGEDYCVTHAEESTKLYGDYVKNIGTCMRNHMMLIDMKAGKGPIYIHTDVALQTLGETMTVVSNEIHKRNLRSGANWIVTSPDVGAIIESIASFKPNATFDPTEVSYSMGVEKIGTLTQRYTVYKDPYFPTDAILMGYKGAGFLDAGFVYAPYVPLVVTPTIFEPNDFTPRKGVMHRAATQMVRPEYYGRIFVANLNVIGSAV